MIDQLTPDSDTPTSDALSLRKPDFTKNVANIHYMSEATGEIGVIVFRRGQTDINSVLRQYCRHFPLEAKIFAEEIKRANTSLLNSSGMSHEGRMMSIAKIPDVIMTACKYLYGEDYWDDKRNTLSFIRSHPGFMVGDHRRKDRGNDIIH